MGILYSEERESSVLTVRQVGGEFLFYGTLPSFIRQWTMRIVRPEGVAYVRLKKAMAKKFTIRGRNGWVCVRALFFWFSSFANWMHAPNAFIIHLLGTPNVLAGAVEVDFMKTIPEWNLISSLAHTHRTHTPTLAHGLPGCTLRHRTIITLSSIFYIYLGPWYTIPWNTTPRPFRRWMLRCENKYTSIWHQFSTIQRTHICCCSITDADSLCRLKA